MPPAIRTARPDDAATLADIHVRAWREAYPTMVEPHVLDNLDPEVGATRWTEIIAGDHRVSEVVVATGSDDLPIGFCAISAPTRDEEEGDGVAEIAAIYVDPNAYRSGAGTAMMEEALSRLHAGFWHTCTVWTLTDNHRAHAFYARFGFERDGHERPDKYWHVPDVRLRLTLARNSDRGVELDH